MLFVFLNVLPNALFAFTHPVGFICLNLSQLLRIAALALSPAQLLVHDRQFCHRPHPSHKIFHFFLPLLSYSSIVRYLLQSIHGLDNLFCFNPTQPSAYVRLNILLLYGINDSREQKAL